MPRMFQISEFRTKLLSEIFIFLQKAALLTGITRIALIGSLTTEKSNPKDIDLLVNIGYETDLAPLAKLRRQLNGHVQIFNLNAEVFLANLQNQYIGRICHWKDCGPGIRVRCKAQHCGGRHYLYDDLHIVRLNDALILEPPIELWSKIICRVSVPADVEEILLKPWRKHLQQ